MPVNLRSSDQIAHQHLQLRNVGFERDPRLNYACTSDVKYWYLSNGLQLNDDKSEVMIAGTAHQLRSASSIPSIPVADVLLPTSSELKTLGVIIDNHLTFDRHVSAVVRACNYHLQAISHIRQLISQDVAQTLVCSLITSKLDFCNALLHGAARGTISKLQRVQNNAARVVTHAGRRTESAPLLRSLHWLPVTQRLV